MESVKLLDGIFKQSQEKGKEYLRYLDVDRLVAPCYEAVGKQPKKPRYGGWEAKEIAGHSVGHWLSAAAAMYIATRDKNLLDKLEYAVNELKTVQSIDGTGFVSGISRNCFDKVFSGDFQVENFSLGGSWVPWYSIHKIYAGLIDVYRLTGNQIALEVVGLLADWAVNGLTNLTEEQFQKMLICEHGGMNEVFADLYEITGNENYLKLAKRFCHRAILNPLAKGIDDLEGKHANTQIPKVIGAAKLYDITGEQYYQDIAEFFWENVVYKRSYVIGGNSIGEHFGPESSEQLGITTTETCNTYNMLKLTEFLYRWHPNGQYIDFYERCLYNHILASQDPHSGMKAYFVSTEPGHFKVYCTPDDSFWCCTGTGMENPARYTRNIYYYEQDKLYINLFLASEIQLQDKNMTIKQKTTFPETDRTILEFTEANGEEMELYIRIPYWLAGDIKVTVNGDITNGTKKEQYYVIAGQWQTGDELEIRLPMNIHLYAAKDDREKQAIMYGPIVLAGALGHEHFPETDIVADHLSLNNHELIEVPTLVVNNRHVNEWVRRVGSSLTFETSAIGQPGNVNIKLIPFYALHHERYTIYWKVMDEAAYHQFEEQRKVEQAKRRAVTIDIVAPNEQQPEVDHDIQVKNSASGYLNFVHKGWRDSRGEGGFFSYEMNVDSKQQNLLAVKYFGNDNNLFIDGIEYERNFVILIDETVIAHQRLRNNQPAGGLFEVVYEIPQNLTLGKKKVVVKFMSSKNTIAGGVYDVRTVLKELF